MITRPPTNLLPGSRRGVAALLVAVMVMAWGTPGHEPADALVEGGTVLVTFDAPPTSGQVESLWGVATGVHPYEHVPAAAVVVDPLDVEILERLPGVRGVWANTSMAPLLRQSTRTIGADRAWQDGWTGAGIGVAIIDTGIDGTHPDLCAAPEFCLGTPVKTVQNVKILGRESRADPVVVLEDQVSTDTSSGHGTHVAGIAAGLGVGSDVGDDHRGVAPGADLIGLGTGEAIEAVNVLAAFDWVIDNAAAHNIRVVNNSWGPGPDTPHDPGHPVNLAIGAAHDAGITVLFGAGNAGPTTDTLNAFSADPRAMSVAGGTKDGHIAFFSSRGVPGSDLWRPDITAPGYMIAAPRSATGFYATLAGALSPNPDPVAVEDEDRYVTSSGTSMASPHVAGVVALMQQAAFEGQGAYLTPDEVQAILQHTAVRDDATRGPGGMPNYQPYSMGAGYADAAAAVTAAAAGTHRSSWDDGVVTDVATFAGTVGPAALVNTQTFSSTIEVLTGATSLNVMADWAVAANDIDLDLHRPDGSLAASTFLRCDPNGEPNGYSSFCSQIANERLTVVAPAQGRWRVVVKGGLAQTAEDVTGLWSVDYPDGTAVPPAAAPATITVVADPGPAGVAGGEVTLTATVTDADGAPVPGAAVAWSSDGVGELVAGETQAHAHGWASGRATSLSPGTQTVTVTAGDAAASIELTWLGLDLDLDLTGQDSTPGRAAGGGWLEVDGARVHVGVAAEMDSEGTQPAGRLSVRDGLDGTTVRADTVERLVVEGDGATIEGPATVDGESGHRYRLVVEDRGEPGRDLDTFDLIVTRPLDPLFRYVVSGTLGGGNLRVAAAAP